MKHDKEQLDHLRHSAAHLLAAAVMELWPDTKRTIGPAIEHGFYYDFDFSSPISEEDLPRIEAKMRELAPTWKEFARAEVSADQARDTFKNNPYKLEMIDEFSSEGQTLTLYTSGTYTDLCRGGHVDHPSNELTFFKLMSVAGAYWRGDEKNKMLTRIYGTAFFSQEELDAYLAQLEEAKKRDHKKLGRDLDLFTFSELVGSGLPLWTPKGTAMRNILDQFVWSLRHERGYEQVEIPHITKKDLYETSGHWDKFKDELFKITTREGHLFAMKPMNCPHHTQIYARRQWSYRELPQRYANTTMCYRDEQTGELSGLSRVRSLTQDDAHVFCRLNQAEDEMLKIWDIVQTFYGAVGLELKLRVSLHDPKQPEKYLGDKQRWQEAEAVLRKVAQSRTNDYLEAEGEAAFYGPKLDFMAYDSLGREWQVATIQLDLNMPDRFDLSCINEKGEHERIVMIHAAIMGSIERFLSIIIEHFAGNFPVWLAPVQVKILSVGEDHIPFCQKMAESFATAGIRTEIDDSNETVGNKIRKVSGEKIPYVLVIGEREMNAENLAVRIRGEKDTVSIAREKFISVIQDKATSRTLDIAL